MKENFIPVIGIEVHLELKTKSKMFCGCKADHFRVKPNSHTCPICLGLPGALPVPNKKAIDWCLLIGLALNCQLNKNSKFDRKNYFYPDLAKGYQISQYDAPFCYGGSLVINLSGQKKKIRITRVHMEEDTGKLIHKKIKGREMSLIDFNRSGVPLVEIVTEPDINSSLEVGEYLRKLQQVVRYLGVSDCDMEKGSMRCEINISLCQTFNTKREAKIKLPQYKVEIKNINSFRFVKRAIEYEIERQGKLLQRGKVPLQETRGFDENQGKTFSQRIKEEAHDYRYFPEPDIPPIRLTKRKIERLKNLLPELPDQKLKRFVKSYGLSEYNAKILTADKKVADYFDQLARNKKGSFLKEAANIIVNKKIDINKFTPQQLIQHWQQQKKSKISSVKQLDSIVQQVLKNNQKAVSDYRQGKKEALGFLIGQAMKETKGKAEAFLIRKLLLEKLKQTS